MYFLHTKSTIKQFTDFILGIFLFGFWKLTKNANVNKHSYINYSTGFDSRSEFSITGESFVENVIIFGADISSSVYIDNKRKDVLMFGEGPTQVLDDITLTAEVKHPINFNNQEKRFVLSLHSNGRNSFLFVNVKKTYQIKNSKQNKISWTLFW